MSTSPPTSKSSTTEDTANSTRDCPRWSENRLRSITLGGSAPGYLAYDGSALRTLSAITSRRPFTLLGVLLAILVIVAFVLVALNASASNASPQQTVVFATRELQPRVPITADALGTRLIPVPGTYPKVYFTNVAAVQGMVPLVNIAEGQAITSNEVASPAKPAARQAEIITWFLTYAALKYTLESYHDYAPGEQAPDPKCPSVGDAKGVTLKTIQANYPSLF